MRYCLRPATSDDRAVLRDIYASTRMAELALTPWSEAQKLAFVDQQFDAQRHHYASQFPRSECQLILDGQSAAVLGRLWLDRRELALHVLDISLLPAARAQGLGTRCLQDLMREAAESAVPVSIYVEIHNPARALYARLGFHADRDPEGLYQHMVWQPATMPALAREECLS